MPNTGNVGLEVPTTGSLSGTWGSAALNPDFIALDGLIGGSVTVGLTNLPVTLTAPVGKSIAPTSGPVQSQNKMLVFTGTLSADVTVTLSLPGHYLIDNQTTGAFVITLRGATAATKVIGLPPGFTGSIFNDGSNVKFIDMGRVSTKEHWVGLTAMPAWVAACTVKPFLLCDGTIYNYSDYPALSAILAGTFGGNGITTFAVPDTRGRVSLPYDGTGTRITTAGCGINGQTIGASNGAVDAQVVTLARANLPNASIAVTITDTGHSHGMKGANTNFSNGGNGMYRYLPTDPVLSGYVTESATTGISAAFNLNGNVTQTAINNVQPSIVTGIDVIKT